MADVSSKVNPAPRTKARRFGEKLLNSALHLRSLERGFTGGGVKIIKLKSESRYQRLFNKDSGTLGIRAGHVRLKPGEEVGEHTTNELEEVLLILKGAGELNIGRDGIVKIKERMVLYIPPKTIHNVKNTRSKGMLEYVFITA